MKRITTQEYSKKTNKPLSTITRTLREGRQLKDVISWEKVAGIYLLYVSKDF